MARQDYQRIDNGLADEAALMWKLSRILRLIRYAIRCQFSPRSSYLKRIGPNILCSVIRRHPPTPVRPRGPRSAGDFARALGDGLTLYGFPRPGSARRAREKSTWTPVDFQAETCYNLDECFGWGGLG